MTKIRRYPADLGRDNGAHRALEDHMMSIARDIIKRRKPRGNGKAETNVKLAIRRQRVADMLARHALAALYCQGFIVVAGGEYNGGDNVRVGNMCQGGVIVREDTRVGLGAIAGAR